MLIRTKLAEPNFAHTSCPSLAGCARICWPGWAAARLHQLTDVQRFAETCVITYFILLWAWLCVSVVAYDILFRWAWYIYNLKIVASLRRRNEKVYIMAGHATPGRHKLWASTNQSNFDLLLPSVRNLLIISTPWHLRTGLVCASLQLGSFQHTEFRLPTTHRSKVGDHIDIFEMSRADPTSRGSR